MKEMPAKLIKKTRENGKADSSDSKSGLLLVLLQSAAWRFADGQEQRLSSECRGDLSSDGSRKSGTHHDHSAPY